MDKISLMPTLVNISLLVTGKQQRNVFPIYLQKRIVSFISK
uniref:Uncharacterized protein n=1 Tax=Nelumbo nucifera TaxID=4432 RepID=A0A822XFW8_NELNU|nr:TPA_asm: hypothetical protein HUJ06_021847 [Nelumbo nucifera]